MNKLLLSFETEQSGYSDLEVTNIIFFANNLGYCVTRHPPTHVICDLHVHAHMHKSLYVCSFHNVPEWSVLEWH